MWVESAGAGADLGALGFAADLAALCFFAVVSAAAEAVDFAAGFGAVFRTVSAAAAAGFAAVFEPAAVFLTLGVLSVAAAVALAADLDAAFFTVSAPAVARCAVFGGSFDGAATGFVLSASAVAVDVEAFAASGRGRVCALSPAAWAGCVPAGTGESPCGVVAAVLMLAWVVPGAAVAPW